MRKRLPAMVSLLLFLTAGMGLRASAGAVRNARLTVYTSSKEVIIGQIRDAFMKAHPNIKVDYYTAGAGRIMARIAVERQAGTPKADVLWTSEIPDFYQLKSEGLLQRYVSPEAAAVVSPVTDTDGYFTAARLGTIGIAYNTNRVKVPPAVWTDLLKPEFKDGFGIANPAISGTAMVSVSMIAKNLGWDYIEKLRANGAKMGQGASQVVDDTAVGDLKACLAVDYIAINKIAEGAPLGFVYLDKIIVIPGPVAILKGTPNLEAAKLFVDFLLSREGQTIVAGSYTLPCRKDVPIVEGVGLIPPQEAVKRAMSLDYIKLRAEKVEIIDRFVSIMTRK
jgi:iron(III) transport system substrate-binding protein